MGGSWSVCLPAPGWLGMACKFVALRGLWSESRKSYPFFFASGSLRIPALFWIAWILLMTSLVVKGCVSSLLSTIRGELTCEENLFFLNWFRPRVLMRPFLPNKAEFIEELSSSSLLEKIVDWAPRGLRICDVCRSWGDWTERWRLPKTLVDICYNTLASWSAMKAWFKLRNWRCVWTSALLSIILLLVETRSPGMKSSSDTLRSAYVRWICSY